MRALDRKVASLDERIREEVEASGTTLTEVFGVGSILAAKTMSSIVGDVGRFPNKEHFASSEEESLLSKPLAARSLEVQGLAGGKAPPQPGHMHMIAFCQARSDPRGKAYYRKKLEEGKSRREAMRCLKRRVSDVVFKACVADSRRASLAVA